MKKVFNLLMAGALVALVACNPTDKNGVDDAKEGGNADFKITVTGITESSATVAVVPSNDSIYYYFLAIPADTLNKYDSKEAYADFFLADFIDYIADYNDYYGTSYTLLKQLSQGIDKYEFEEELNPSTVYYAIAFQVDPDNEKVVGSVAYKEFTTLELEKSANVISFELDGDTVINIKTTNDDEYLWTYIQKDTLAKYYDGDAKACLEYYVAYIEDYYGDYVTYYWSYYIVSSGDETYSIKDNFVKGESGTYVFIAAAMYNTIINSDVFTQEIVITEDMCGEETVSGGDDTDAGDTTGGDAEAGDDSSDTKAVRKHIAPASLAKPHFNGAFRTLK